MKRIKDITLIVLSAVMIFGFSLYFLLMPSDDYSMSERRNLAEMPEVSWDSLLSGDFMTKFESFTLDRFPMRDTFRTVKALTSTYVLRQLDNNDMYIQNGYLAKLEYPLNEERFDKSLDKITEIYEKHIKGTEANVFVSVIPDKNYYLAPEGGYLTMDYDAVFSKVKESLDFGEYIDISDKLTLSDFYKTDQHWKQENLIKVAEELSGAMGLKLSYDFTINELETPFFGTYYGQAALPASPDTIKYLTSDVLSECKVTSYDTGMPKEAFVYDMKKAEGKDAYEMFLGGSDPLITIENPNADEERELIIFRDSFGSSLTPLLVSGYSKITMVDLRYMQSDYLGAFIKVDNQDVLFMYSTLVLNNTISMQ